MPAVPAIRCVPGGEPWAIAALDVAAGEASRAAAQVANDRDWPRQGLPSVARAAARLRRIRHRLIRVD